MAKTTPVIAHHQAVNSARNYVIGFSVSLVLTLGSYLSVVHHWFKLDTVIALIIGLALIQFLVQLYFFLHLGKETKPRWKLLVLFMMIGVVLLIVIGSLWIMANLNYRMTPEQMNKYLLTQDGGL